MFYLKKLGLENAVIKHQRWKYPDLLLKKSSSKILHYEQMWLRLHVSLKYMKYLITHNAANVH